MPATKNAKKSGDDTSPNGTRAGGVTSTRQASVTVPSLKVADGKAVAAMLQDRLVGLIDLALTLKHIHWNVVGPNFISVHEMLDPQHAGVQLMIDSTAERIATLGDVPSGLPGRLVQQRGHDDYEVDRADALAHLGALDLVYARVISDHRQAMSRVGELDPVSEDLLIRHAGELEQYHWFVRAHLADWAGGMSNAGATTEIAAAHAVAAKSAKRSTARGSAIGAGQRRTH